MLEFVHKDSYGIALEIAKKFVSKSELRPILNYVFHKENGDMIATDSHRLIYIKEMHGFDKDYLVNPKTFMIAKGDYPDTAKLVDKSEDYKGLIVLNKEQIKLWLQLFKSINQTLTVLKDRGKVVGLSFGGKENEAGINLKNHGINMILPCSKEIHVNHEKVHFNAEYMRDALEAHVKLNSEELTMYFASPFRPFFMDDESQVTSLILPIRAY